MRTHLNYHHLYYFKIIAEEGSISKAAEKLYLGQPALSAQLRQLEEALKVALFERKHRQLLLTEHGRIALSYAQAIFKSGNEMQDALNDRLQPERIALQIGALDSIPKQIILQLTQQALQNSLCKITVIEGQTDLLIRELNAHRIDLFLTNFSPADYLFKGLKHRVITKSSVALFAAPQFRNLRRHFPDSISGVPLIAPTYDSKLRHDLDHWYRINQLSMNVIVESQDTSLNKLLAANGMGVIIVPEYAVKEQVRTKQLIKMGDIPGITEELTLVTSIRRIENPLAAHLFHKFMI